MKFGHFCLPTYYPEIDGGLGEYMRRWVDFLASSEDLGFDALWANEHHFHAYGGILPAPPIMLAALAQRTKRARLGTSIIVPPLHNPIELAEQLAMVDLMSGGRVELGVGRGFVSYDYTVFGVPVMEGSARTTDELNIMLKAWSDQPLNHHSDFYHFENVDVWPKPEQRPHPPVYIACTMNPKSFEWVGGQGYNLLTVAYGPGIQDLPELHKIYREAWIAAGHAPGALTINTHYQLVVAETSAEAKRLCTPALERYRDYVEKTAVQRGPSPLPGPGPSIDYDYLVGEGRIIAGTPDECVKQIERVHDATGFTEMDCTFCWGGIPFEAAQRSRELFAREVMPRVRDRALVGA